MLIRIALSLTSFALGVAVAAMLFNPYRNWSAGFDAAMEMYGDWDKGFAAGWDSAMAAVLRIAQGWRDRDKEKTDGC